MVAIEIANAQKTIKGNSILNNINLSLEEGKIYGFWGKNASGKTMLFRAISGLITLDSGYIKAFDKVIGEDIEYPDSMGLIIENISLWNEYTGFDNLKLLSTIQKKINNSDIEKILIRVGLDPKDKRKYKKYSLGMKQKLSIAQAIMEKPKLIILDEPTNALDEESCNNIRKILLEEKERGATILIASHNRDDINLLCDIIFKVDNGKVSIMGDD